MLRRSARRSGQAPPDESPAISPPTQTRRGRGGGRGRGRGRGKSAVDPTGEAVEESSQEEAVQETPESLNETSESLEETARGDAPGEDPIESEAPYLLDPVEEKEQPMEEEKEEEPMNEEDRREANNSRNEERMRDDGYEKREEERRRDRWEDRNEEEREGGRPPWRRSGSKEDFDGDYDDSRRRGRGGYRHHYGGGYNEGGYGGRGGYGGPPWGGYGRGRGRGDGFRGGWRGRGGGYGGPHVPHPGMMGPPQGHWDNGGYDPMYDPMYDSMGGPHHQHPHMMPPHMRGPGGPGPMPPPHGHYDYDYEYVQPQPGLLPHPTYHPQPPQPPMMGVGPPPVGMVLPPPAGAIPPLPPGPPPPLPPAPSAEIENVKSEEEIAAMKQQIARQIEEAREKALEEKEEKKEEKEEEKSEDKEKRKKQASAMFRAARLNKTTAAAAASISKPTAAPAAVAPPIASTTPRVPSTPQAVPPPSLPSMHVPTSLGASVTAATKTTPKKTETKDVFGKDDDGGMFGERKPTLSLPSAEDRAEMQLYNDVLYAPHPSQDNLSPRKAPAPVPPPTIVVSKPPSDRRGDHSKERRSRSPRSAERGRGEREERSPRRDRSPYDSISPARRERSPKGSRSPRRSPKSSPRKDRERERGRRSRSRSHGRHRSRSRSKDRGERTRRDSGHYSSRRGVSPARDGRAAAAARRRGYELSPIRSVGRTRHRSSPQRERSKSRERKRSPEVSRNSSSSRRREEEKDERERERRRSGGDGRDGRDERRRRESRKDSTRSNITDERSAEEGKENSTPGHDEQEIDKLMAAKEDTVDRSSAVAETVPKNTVVPKETTETSNDTAVSASSSIPTSTSSPKPDPYEEITESMFFAEIKDRNDYGGECMCTDGVCGVSCLLRYLTVECGRRCPSGDGCQNRAMQKTKGARVEVFHTGTEKGFGVRALEPIKKGAFIIEYIGEVVTHKAGEKRKKLYAKEFPTRRHHYLMTVTDSQNKPFIIDATKFGNSSRFLNHSCEPNAICDKWSVSRRFRMGFFAKQNIETGEEITFDYRFQNYGRQLIECACGAPSCRRYLASKDSAKEEQERMRSGGDRLIDYDDDSQSDDDDEEEEEEEEVEIREEDRKKLRKQQSIMDEAERLLKKGALVKKGQYELLCAIMIRLTPSHQQLRTRLVTLLKNSGDKNNEAYRVFLQGNGRTILQKYLSLGVDEETTVAQYRELIPLMEALLELLNAIKKYMETTTATNSLVNLVPLLRSISAQSEVPDGLVVFEVLHDIVSGVEEEATEDEEEGEWTKRWMNCTIRAAELAEQWRIAYSVISTFKIPKKKEEKGDTKKENERSAVKSMAAPVSMIRPPTFTRSIKSEAAAGWQSNEKKDRRDSRDFASFSKDRFASDRSGGGYRKRKYEEESAERREERREHYRREEEKKREAKEEAKKEPAPAKNSSVSPRCDEDAMQISPNIDETERNGGGEPEAKRVAYDNSPEYSPLPNYQDYNSQQQRRPLHYDQVPGPMPPPLGTGPWGQHWAYGAYPNGLPPAPTMIQGISYFNLMPPPGSSLPAELTFWEGGMKYCQQKAEEIRHRLAQAAELEAAQNAQQTQLLQHTVAAEQPLLAAEVTPAPPKEDKPTRLPLNDRLAELTGMPIKKGGGARTPPEDDTSSEQRRQSPTAVERPSDEEIAVAKNVRTKDGRLIPINSIAKFCKVRTETPTGNALYYYNKFTRSPTWTLPDGEEANSEDELEVDIASGRQSSASGGASGEQGGTGGGAGPSTSAATSRSSTGAGKTPVKGRPQTPPEEPTDPISSKEMSEKEKLQRKSEFKTRSGDLVKRYVKASMFNNVEEFKKTLRKIIHCCIEKEQKVYPNFDYSFTDAVKGRLIEYVKKYVERHKLKPLTYPAGIAD